MTWEALPPFVPGLALSERFFHTAVEPLLAAHFAGLCYAAGCLGRGSDVMGFDTPQSRDHHWGPKTTLFLPDEDVVKHGDAIVEMLGQELPFSVGGYPTHFDTPNVDGGFLSATDRRPVAHGVSVTAVARFTNEYLSVDATQPIDERAWLARCASSTRCWAPSNRPLFVRCRPTWVRSTSSPTRQTSSTSCR